MLFLSPRLDMSCVGGTEPKTLIRLYKTYVRSVIEYGSVCFMHCPETTLAALQKVQNKAIRICLRLPRYVSLRLLHEASCLPTIKERFLQLGTRLVAKMGASNPLLRTVIRERGDEMLRTIRQHGQVNGNQPHRSPLDIILSAQRPFPSST